MKDFKAIFQFLAGYKSLVSMSLICHVLMAIFTIISIPLVIPFFHFLFSTAPDTAIRPASVMDVIGWLEYYFVKLINTHGSQKALVLTCVFLSATFFFKNLFRYLAMYFMIPVRSSIVNELRSGLYDNYISLSVEQMNEQKRGDLLARITSDVQEVEWSILRFVQTIFKAPIIILGSVFLMLSIHKGLTLFVFVLMLFTLLVIGTLSKTLKKSSANLQGTLAKLTTKVDETLDGSMLLKVFRVSDKWKQGFDQTNQRHKNIYDSVTRRQELSSPLSEFLGVTVVVVLLWYGAQLVFQDKLKPEAFFAFIFAFYHVIEPLKSFSTAFYNIRKGSASLDRIQSYTSLKMAEPMSEGLPFNFNISIKFENVSFRYGERRILDAVSFEIMKGEKIAIVGDSGSGKSTIVGLLLKSLKAEEGQILVDGVPIEKLSRNSLYKNLGLVTQSPFLYNDTIKANITLGREEVSDRDIQRSLKLASAEDFVAEQEEGIETQIGDRGELLSGGEKQRITIARALLENPSLLIFDEPTSSLDPASEHKVSSAILTAMADRTAIIIAHRLYTIKSADRILFLAKGQIIESGSHQELMSTQGHYTDYVNLQTI